jgi:hypothetical protein
MTTLDALLPRTANNDYRGGRVPLYFFYALMAVVTFRSFVHFLKDDSGVNSIASIILFSGTPDPNNVVYMFSSLWGSQQVIMLMVYVVVVARYRNLIPLMWALVVVEVLFRLGVGMLHPLTAEYYLRTPPGKIGNLPMLAISLAMVVLAIRNTKIKQGTG